VLSVLRDLTVFGTFHPVSVDAETRRRGAE
jgi:hypothetical protein